MKDTNIHPSSVLGPEVTVAPDATIGPNCFLSGRMTVGPGCCLIGGITLIGNISFGDRCIVEPGVTMTVLGVEGERSSQPLVLGDGVSIGAGSVLSSGVTVGTAARIGAGTVVTRNIPAYAIVCGNPASIIGYTTSTTIPDDSVPLGRGSESAALTRTKSSVDGVELFRFPRIRDLRGDLSVGEFTRNVPFAPKRYFLVYDVPSAETRGEHAHHECEQFLICVSGRVSILVDDGMKREQIELDAPNVGLYIPPKVWALQYRYSANAVLLVFASHFYDPGDYVRDYGTFQKLRASPQ